MQNTLDSILRSVILIGAIRGGVYNIKIYGMETEKEQKQTPKSRKQQNISGKKTKPKKTPDKNDTTVLKKERQEYLEGWQRERANFANYKKEMERYIASVRTLSKNDTIVQLLPLFDNMDLIMKHIPQRIMDAEKEWYQGVQFVYTQFQQSLSDIGLKEIECAVGDVFNPSFHEALEGEGTIIREVVQKGYTLNDAVLRCTKVKVRPEKQDAQE